MWRIALAGMRAHKLRTALSGLAIVIGVSFLAGALVYGDTAKAGFYDDLARAGTGVDIAVQPAGGPGYLTLGYLDARTLAALRAVPGVAHAEGRAAARLGLLDHDGRALSNGAFVGAAIAVPEDPALAMYHISEGRTPQRDGEVAIDEPTAQREGFVVGGEVSVLGHDGQKYRLRVVGTVDFGTNPNFAGWSAIVLTEPDLQRFAARPRFAELVATATPGTDPEQLRDRVSAAIDPDYEVLTGDQMRDALAAQSGKYVNGFLAVMLSCALVALVVACLVVFNTFTILVAQRTRELALLRCVGAHRGQVFRLVAVESVIVGAVAATGGVLFSTGVGKLMLVGRDVFGGGVPDHQLVVSARTVVVAVVAGTFATVVSGLLPAVAASRVPPLAALQSAQTAGPSRTVGRTRAVARLAVAGLLVAVGLALVFSGFDRGFDGTPAVLAGSMAVFVAIVATMPLAVPWLTTLLGWLPSRFSVTARLATANARRNPVRVAATTTALMIGIALISMFTVVLATARVQADRELTENFPVDFEVQRTSGDDGADVLSDGLVARLRGVPEFSAVVRTRVFNGHVDEPGTRISAVEPDALGTSIRPEMMTGSLADLVDGTVALRQRFAADHDIAIGDTVSVGGWTSDVFSARVVAFFDDTPTEGDALISWSDFVTHLGRGEDRVLIRRGEGISAARARAALDGALRGEALVSVTSRAEERESLARTLDKRLAQLGGLLGMSVVIAVLGIMDTLSLSVIERTRESAVLRALGLARRQLRLMLVVEALLMALIGAAVGVAFGVLFGWVAAAGLIDSYGHGVPEIPVLPLAAYISVAAVAGVLASVVPARRAARASVVSAMADT